MQHTKSERFSMQIAQVLLSHTDICLRRGVYLILISLCYLTIEVKLFTHFMTGFID